MILLFYYLTLQQNDTLVTSPLQLGHYFLCQRSHVSMLPLIKKLKVWDLQSWGTRPGIRPKGPRGSDQIRWERGKKSHLGAPVKMQLDTLVLVLRTSLQDTILNVTSS